jgi:hypothetical protein
VLLHSCSQLYKPSTQRLNIDMKPKEVLIEAVNKFLKEKLKEKGFVFSDLQLKITKGLTGYYPNQNFTIGLER